MEKRERNWCFTINNYTEEDFVRMSALGQLCNDAENSPIRYLIYGLELGEEKKTPHIQGFIIYHNAKTLKTMKKHFHPTAHLEPARVKDLTLAADYCKKEGKYFEFGEPPKQGKRTDQDNAKADLDKGLTIQEVYSNNFSSSCKFWKFYNEYRRLSYRHRDPANPPKVYWVYGATGLGKSSYVYKQDPTTYFKPQGKWWDGYDQQPTILIDDIAYTTSHEYFRFMLTLLDRYPLTVEFKGGSIPFNSPTIYITSDRHPKNFWAHLTPSEYAQFERRLTDILHFVKPDFYVSEKTHTIEVQTSSIRAFSDDDDS